MNLSKAAPLLGVAGTVGLVGLATRRTLKTAHARPGPVPETTHEAPRAETQPELVALTPPQPHSAKQPQCGPLPLIVSDEFAYHITGSAALEGIAKHDGLLSIKEIRRRGEELRTGFCVWKDAEEYFGHNTKVSFVHGKLHHNILWQANEGERFPVVFAVPCASLPPSRGSGTEVRSAGPWVPLASISYVASPPQHVDQVQAWVDKHLPETTVYSFDPKKIPTAHEM